MGGRVPGVGPPDTSLRFKRHPRLLPVSTLLIIPRTSHLDVLLHRRFGFSSFLFSGIGKPSPGSRRTLQSRQSHRCELSVGLIEKSGPLPPSSITHIGHIRAEDLVDQVVTASLLQSVAPGGRTGWARHYSLTSFHHCVFLAISGCFRSRLPVFFPSQFSFLLFPRAAMEA